MGRNTVKLLTHGGDMIELCHELRLPFVSWVISHQVFTLLQGAVLVFLLFVIDFYKLTCNNWDFKSTAYTLVEHVLGFEFLCKLGVHLMLWVSFLFSG
jgi:hypothetical protein